MLQIPYGKTHIPFDEKDAAVLLSRIGELRAEGDGLSIVRAAMGVWVVADVFIMGATLRAPQRRLSNWAKLVEASNATAANNINAFFILFVI